MELLWTPEDKIDSWAQQISKAAIASGGVYICADTETTDSNLICPVTGQLNRVIEMAFLFYTLSEDKLRLEPILDKNGEHICYHELTNFFMEDHLTKKKFSVVDRIHPSTFDVHGITETYLLGEKPSKKDRPKLSRPALHIGEQIPLLIRLISFDASLHDGIPVHLIAHNAPFDIRFLNSEMRVHGYPPIESYFSVIDTEYEMKRLFIKGVDVEDNKLDTLYKYGVDYYFSQEEVIERPFHDARTDSEILAKGYEVLLRRKQELALL